MRIAYGLYAWLQFVLIGLVGLILLLCLPSLSRRRALIRRLARLVLRLAGMRLHVGDLSALPRPCVVVANHCSYLDGVVLAAVLPPDFGFVIKREMSSVPLAGVLLNRIGAEFVERRDQAHVLRDTRRLMRHALAGQALAFFPEGTFSTQVGLLRFHIGAFAAAARANLPVVPIAIRGTRHCLPPGSAWPQPGPVDVHPLAALPALPPGVAQDGPRAAALRDRSRGALLAALGEPDLA
ncbi:MAG TPA: lysophospholipid acyltransferase family protein [Steroidobacteraceae bacterium]|nr:lysophospholipid acyltransferase family protein [Steroidobacteraceae bacterium]